MRRLFESVALLALIAGGLALAGCGGVKEYRLPETGATLQGTVKHNNKAVPAAMIIVVSDSGSATGNANPDGTYSVTNVPLGTVRIAVNTAAARGQMMGAMMAQGVKKEKGGSAPPPPTIVDVPEKYHNPETSGVTTTIQTGDNTFDIVLE